MKDAPPHMSAIDLVDIPLSKDSALVADWHRLRKTARGAGWDLHQHSNLFELARDWREQPSLVRFKTLQEVQEFLTRGIR